MLASSARLSSAHIAQELQNLKEYGPCVSNALSGINTVGAKGQPSSVRPLLRLLAQKYSFMDGYTQQDSHEALMLLLDKLDEELAANNKKNGNPKGTELLVPRCACAAITSNCQRDSSSGSSCRGRAAQHKA